MTYKNKRWCGYHCKIRRMCYNLFEQVDMCAGTRLGDFISSKKSHPTSSAWKKFFSLRQNLCINNITKHCQRHKGPEGWVLLTKVTYFSHITRSNTNFKISTSANISISTKLKIQDIDQSWLQNLDQDSTSLPLQNISSKILNKLLLQILPELQLQNIDQSFCSKSEQKFNFMIKPPLP